MIKKKILFCRKCCLTSEYPSIEFNDGICNFCKEFNYNEYKKKLSKNKSQLDNFLKTLSSKKMKYHCLVALSGGKDSSYTCYILKKKYNLNIIAITVENGFLSDQAIKNCKLISKKLKFKHILIKPNSEKFRNLYKNSVLKRNNSNYIKRSSDICSNCINLINKIMVKNAIKKDIPVIAGGYISGQVPEGSLILNLQLNFLKSQNKTISNFNEYALGKNEVKDFKHEFLSIINPMLAENYNEEKFVEVIKKLGWKKSTDTGLHSSNCKINDLGIKIHLNKYGFHPYSSEIASQIRTKQITRKLAIMKISEKINNEKIAKVAKKIGLKI